jgi:membrane protease YdiL (CAAX protease family)
MFRIRYWRDYPWWMQLIQLGLMIFIFLGLATGLSFVLVPKLTGVALQDIASVSDKSPRALINAALLSQFIASACLFLLPAFFFAYATHPRPVQYLGLKAPRKSMHWIVSILLILSAMPLLLNIPAWLHQIALSGGIKQTQDNNDRLLKAFMTMSGLREFLTALFLLAILPAISEELMFRGIIMRFAAKRFRSIYPPIFISALFFALLHSNVYGFVSIFIAGLLLGYIYYLTGSIWCNIMAHMAFNGLQIVLTYFAAKEVVKNPAADTDTLPLYMVAGGIALFGLFFYVLWKNRTPLPADWTNDFAGEPHPSLPPT